MADTSNPATIAKWLRRCVSGIDRCHRCPYGPDASGDDDRDCLKKLHEAAAQMIERQNNLERQV